MTDKVRCKFCGGTYDLMKVTPIARFADCTTFKTPCCDKLTDDRGHDFQRPLSARLLEAYEASGKF